jgi:hypothetical protein
MKRVTNSEEQKMKKSLIAILTTVVMLLSMMAPLISTVKSGTADVSSWYTSVNGVLSTDAYSLYPWTANSVNVGFSKFGELIGLPAGKDPQTAAQSDWVGLEYAGSGRDPFCPATVVPMSSWINGWFINIEYTDPALAGAQRDRDLWAFAMFGDGFNWGGDWTYTAGAPGSNPGYGRQTDGMCVTDPLQVLYNGPREYIAMAVTHISDKQGTVNWPVLDLAITMVFNKVNKEVMLYKDVKLTIPKMHLWDTIDVQLSNREEYDLGSAPGYSSYAHYYPQVDATAYGPSWELAQNILRDNIEHLVGNGTTKVFDLSPPADSDLAGPFMKVWVNGYFVDPTNYTVSYPDKTITFLSAPADQSDIKVLYKYVYLFAEEWNGEYDLAQVVSNDTDSFFGFGNYVAWAAMWPPCSDYTVDGILRYLQPLYNVQEQDCELEPKQSPLIIGQWEFLMDKDLVYQYRCVEVKGITANTLVVNAGNCADDANMPGVVGYIYPTRAHDNFVGDEVWYQLDQIFWPQDLSDSIDEWMYFTRHVDMFTVSAGAGISTLQLPGIAGAWSPIPPGLTTGAYLFLPDRWVWYDEYTEKVLVNGTLWPRYPDSSTYAFNYYTINATGYIAFYTFSLTTFTYVPVTLSPTTRVKVLYSTFTRHYSGEGWYFESGQYTWMTVGRDAATVDSAGASLVSEAFAYDQYENVTLGIAGADIASAITANSMPWVMSKWGGTGDTWADYYKSTTDNRTALKDDWCTYWPVASSTMIGVGGPLANMLAYYANDFTTALYGLPQYSGAAYSNAIVPVPCWDRAWAISGGKFNTYTSSNSVGYAVISTTVDLNGTVMFLVWGNWGRDTYYATQWLHGDAARSIAPGLLTLEGVPEGTTSIVLRISYGTDPSHPTFGIPEVLGTVSETLWTIRSFFGNTLYGGIHDP